MSDITTTPKLERPAAEVTRRATTANRIALTQATARKPKPGATDIKPLARNCPEPDPLHEPTHETRTKVPMKPKQTITIEIDQQGNSTVTTTGFTGASCQQATKALEAALGTVISDDKTPEFYQGQTQSRPQQENANQ